MEIRLPTIGWESGTVGTSGKVGTMRAVGAVEREPGTREMARECSYCILPHCNCTPLPCVHGCIPSFSDSVLP